MTRADRKLISSTVRFIISLLFDMAIELHKPSSQVVSHQGRLDLYSKWLLELQEDWDRWSDESDL